MRPDEWRQGMENEAASVTDPQWAVQTELAAHRLSALTVLRCALAFAMLGILQVVLVQVVWATEPPAHLWPWVMIAVVSASAILAACGRTLLAIAGGALAYFPGAWLAVSVMQFWTPPSALTSPGLEDAGAVVLVGVAACSAATVHHVLAIVGNRRA